MRAAYYVPIPYQDYFALSARNRGLLTDALNDLIDELNEMGGTPIDER